jgi:hypothetical protein
VRRHVHEVAVVPGPGVVDQVESGLGSGHPGDLRAPGVEAEHEVGVVLARAGEERHHPLDLLLGRHDLALLPGAHSPHVDDVGAGRDGRVERTPGRGQVTVTVPRPERVGRAVDDGHDGRAGGVEGATTQAQRTRRRGDPGRDHGIRDAGCGHRALTGRRA